MTRSKQHARSSAKSPEQESISSTPPHKRAEISTCGEKDTTCGEKDTRQQAITCSSSPKSKSTDTEDVNKFKKRAKIHDDLIKDPFVLTPGKLNKTKEEDGEFTMIIRGNTKSSLNSCVTPQHTSSTLPQISQVSQSSNCVGRKDHSTGRIGVPQRVSKNNCNDPNNLIEDRWVRSLVRHLDDGQLRLQLRDIIPNNADELKSILQGQIHYASVYLQSPYTLDVTSETGCVPLHRISDLLEDIIRILSPKFEPDLKKLSPKSTFLNSSKKRKDSEEVGIMELLGRIIAGTNTRDKKETASQTVDDHCCKEATTVATSKDPTTFRLELYMVVRIRSQVAHIREILKKIYIVELIAHDTMMLVSTCLNLITAKIKMNVEMQRKAKRKFTPKKQREKPRYTNISSKPSPPPDTTSEEVKEKKSLLSFSMSTFGWGAPTGNDTSHPTDQKCHNEEGKLQPAVSGMSVQTNTSNELEVTTKKRQKSEMLTQTSHERQKERKEKEEEVTTEERPRRSSRAPLKTSIQAAPSYNYLPAYFVPPPPSTLSSSTTSSSSSYSSSTSASSSRIEAPKHHHQQHQHQQHQHQQQQHQQHQQVYPQPYMPPYMRDDGSDYDYTYSESSDQPCVIQ